MMYIVVSVADMVFLGQAESAPLIMLVRYPVGRMVNQYGQEDGFL